MSTKKNAKATAAEDDDLFEIEEEAPEEQEEVEVAGDDDDIEIIDDTPEKDRGRDRRDPDAKPELPDDDEIAQYSEGVQKRIKHMRWEYHEERRAKEEAERLRDEAIRYAQNAYREAQNLKKTLSEGEKQLSTTSKERAEAGLNAARSKYKRAYEEGDVDAQIEAQEEIARYTNELSTWSNYQPRYQLPEGQQQPQQPQQAPQQPQRQQPQRPVDQKAIEWTKRNPWFGKNQRMTGYAMGLHEELVRNGVHPQSDDYYKRVDSEMRRTFPEAFETPAGGSEGQNDPSTPSRSANRQAGTVVAGANRSSKTPRKVQLTATQVALAKRLGLTPKEYAEGVLELQKRDQG